MQQTQKQLTNKCNTETKLTNQQLQQNNKCNKQTISAQKPRQQKNAKKREKKLTWLYSGWPSPQPLDDFPSLAIARLGERKQPERKTHLPFALQFFLL